MSYWKICKIQMELCRVSGCFRLFRVAWRLHFSVLDVFAASRVDLEDDINAGLLR